MTTVDSLAEKFNVINFTQMDDVALAKWLRANVKKNTISLYDTLAIVKVIRQAYKLGEVRGKSIKA